MFFKKPINETTTIYFLGLNTNCISTSENQPFKNSQKINYNIFKPYEKIATNYQLFKRCYLHHLDHPDDPSPLHNFQFKRKLSPIPDEYYDQKVANKNDEKEV